jgi:hypothetical protein
VTEKQKPAVIYSEMWDYMEIILNCNECGRTTDRCECEEDE